MTFERRMGTTVLVLLLASAATVASVACDRDRDAVTPDKLEQRYGVSGAYTEDVQTTEGPIRSSTVVPVTLADGGQAELVIPSDRRDQPHAVYVRDREGLHPVEVSDGASRDEIARAPAIVDRRTEGPHPNKRSWEKDALIVGGSAGAGSLVGAIASGKKGAAIGATAGGIGGLIYDLAARDKK